ncbi:hypothetical protein BS78_03G377600 [Paspalum vaginatum]|nr:hypothetical protein BS78_03G377600 [Paspalum vaginatum]
MFSSCIAPGAYGDISVVRAVAGTCSRGSASSDPSLALGLSVSVLASWRPGPASYAYMSVCVPMLQTPQVVSSFKDERSMAGAHLEKTEEQQLKFACFPDAFFVADLDQVACMAMK